MSPLEKRIQRVTKRKEQLEANLPEKQALYDATVQRLADLEARLAAQQ